MKTTFYIFLLVFCYGCSGILKKYEKFDVEVKTGIHMRPESFFFIDSLRGLCSGQFGNVFTTEDGGKSWERCTSLNIDESKTSHREVKQFIYKQGRIYAHLNFWGNDPDEVFVSDNFGKDWRLLFKCDTTKHNLLDFHVQDSLNLYRSIQANRGRVAWQYSKDGGKTWHLALRLLSPSSSWEFDSDTLLYRYETDPSNYSRDEWTVDEVMDLLFGELIKYFKNEYGNDFYVPYRHETNVKDKGKIVRYFTRNLKTGKIHLYRLPQDYEFTRFFSNNFVPAEKDDSVILFRLEKGKCIRHSSLPERLKKYHSVDYFFNDGIRFCILVSGLGNRDCIFISNNGGKSWQKKKLGSIGYYTIYSEPNKMKIWFYFYDFAPVGSMEVFEF